MDPVSRGDALRTVWLSDVHLGSRDCRVNLVLDFLRRTRCELLYLVGDIVDLESLRMSFYWPASHMDVLRTLLEMSRDGTRIVYIPGNHDDELRAFAGATFGNVEIALEAIHTTRTGRRLLVTHGDAYDGVVLYARWLAFLGDAAYGLLLRANVAFNWVRRRLRLPYWSLSAYLKRKVKNAVQYVCDFEEAVAHEALQRGLDGAVCGHIHCAEIRQFGGITYHNSGDWVESCTALVEDSAGHITILDWAAAQAAAECPAAATLEQAA